MKKKKPSHTAMKVALNIIALSHVESVKKDLPPGIVEATTELLKASGAAPLKRIRQHQSPDIVKLYKKFDWLLPGQFESFGYRKAFMEKSVRDSITNGAEQVLVLGAGYDTTGYRLSREFPAVNFFEIDEPATASMKITGLKKLGAAGNLFVIPEDLGKKRLSDVLEADSNWKKNKKTVFTAEGLLQYLDRESVIGLFKECHKNSGEGSRIAFTYIGSRPDGGPDAGPHSRLMVLLMNLFGEPWLWWAKGDELKNILNESGWEFPPGVTGREFRKIEYYTSAVRR